MKTRFPVVSGLILAVLGLLPVALVTEYYGVLPNRIVIRWDMLDRMSVIGTRSQTVLMVAYVGAGLAVIALAILSVLHNAMRSAGVLRAFLMLNLAQLVVINLTCGMIVSDALGQQLKLKPIIAPAVSVALAAAGVLIWKSGLGQNLRGLAGFGLIMVAAAVGMLAFAAIAAGSPTGYYASAFAVLAIAALFVSPAKA